MRALVHLGAVMLWTSLGVNADITLQAETRFNEGSGECEASLRRITADVKEGAKEIVELRAEHRYE